MADTPKKIWDCKIGFANEAELPDGADAPMREAVRRAYLELTGWEPEFIFSGWGGQLTASEQRSVLGADSPGLQQFLAGEHYCPRRGENPMGEMLAEEFRGPDHWHLDNSCTYCGSLNPDEFMQRLEAGDIELDPTSKTYKVYVRNRGGQELQQYYRDCPAGSGCTGPSDCTHWATRPIGQVKFYFQHLSRDQRRRFVEMLNANMLHISEPGYFQPVPFFCIPMKRAADTPHSA